MPRKLLQALEFMERGQRVRRLGRTSRFPTPGIAPLFQCSWRPAEEPDMGSRRLLRPLVAATAALLLTGCLMPKRGTPVYVDAWAGDFWSGKGLLLEVTPDQKRCKVAVRDRALLVREMWVDCTSVHPRKAR